MKAIDISVLILVPRVLRHVDREKDREVVKNMMQNPRHCSMYVDDYR